MFELVTSVALVWCGLVRVTRLCGGFEHESCVGTEVEGGDVGLAVLEMVHAIVKDPLVDAFDHVHRDPSIIKYRR
jgi:hypothetical protein